jgi:acid phosphatase
MLDDGHDTNITFAASWERKFFNPLLNNTYLWNNTLILLTFDEIETYTEPNKIFSILLGGAIPENLKGTSDDTFYNHYSTISTVSVNWGLPSLGRWDCEANVFALVANKTGYTNAKVDTTNLYFNTSYPGPLSDSSYIPAWPVPNTTATCAAGLGVLDAVKKTYGKAAASYNYTNVYPYDAANDNNNGGTPVSGGQVSSASSSAGTSAPGSGSGGSGGTATSSGAAGSTTSAKSAATFNSISVVFVIVFAVALGVVLW